METVNKRIVILMTAYMLEHYDELKDKSIEDICQQSYKYVNAYVRNSKFKQAFDDIIEKYNCKKYANHYQEYMDTEDLTGMKFGRLTVTSRAPDKINKNKRVPMWNCLCDCGNPCVVNGYLLQSGKTQSCGCIRKETSRKMMKKYNTFDLSGDIGIGYTTKGEEFYFDIEDYDKIKDICWSIDAYGVVVAVLEDYLAKLRKYVDGLSERKCKGVPYKRVKGRDIFVFDLEKKLYCPIRLNIERIVNAKSYAEMYRLLQKFMRNIVKLPYDIPKSKAWIDAYKGAGAYYTMKNLVMSHKCYISDNGYHMYGPLAIRYLEEKLDEYQGEYYRMFALMKKVIEDNNFNFTARMVEIGAYK